MADYVYFDAETHNAGREFDMPAHEFVRLFQWAVNDEEPRLLDINSPSDLEQARDILRSADYVVGHNIIAADLGWIFGQDSIEPLRMAQEKRVLDTFYLANLLTPPPSMYTDSKGHRYFDAAKPERAMKWLSLENLCHQFCLPGKFGSLKDLAKKYQPEGTKVADYDYGLIPLDDPDFRYYAAQDIVADRALFKHLMTVRNKSDYPGAYLWREMEAASVLVGQMHRNGIRVNQEYAAQRIGEMDSKKTETMDWLVREYDFPTEGKAPWNSDKGKGTILKVMDDFGIRFEDNPDWPRTPTGAPKMGGDELKALCEGVSSEAEAFAEALSALKGQRTIPQLFLDNMKSDGRVHPDVSILQRSGRLSIQRPGITVIGERSEALRADKELLIADEGNVLAGFDYSSADARAMAALSGDKNYAKQFEEDEDGNAKYDGHNLTGEAVFGADAYYGDLEDRGPHARPPLRAVAKTIVHSTNYRVGAYKLAITLNAASKEQGLGLHFWAPSGRGAKEIPHQEGEIETRGILDSLDRAYPYMKYFKDKAVEEAETLGYVTNTWGRRMQIEEGREYTGAPAMYGQSTTTEIMKDAVIALARKGEYYARSLRCVIHDELLCEFREDTIEEDIAVVKECMEVTFDPKTKMSQPIDFPVGSGYGKTWKEAGH